MKVRLSASTDSLTQLKQELHRRANVRLKQAIEDGYWIEAICIAESLMSDRIESVYQRIDAGAEIKTLGFWVRQVIADSLASGQDLSLFLAVKDWSENRSSAVHEAVKVSDKNLNDWTSRVALFERTAREGQEFAKQVNNWSKRMASKSSIKRLKS